MFPGCLVALGGVPYLAAKWDSPALRQTVRRELRDISTDIVYVDHLGMARYLPDIRAERPASRVVLDQHNVESDLYKQLVERWSGRASRLPRGVASGGALREARVLGGCRRGRRDLPGGRTDHFAGVAHVPIHVVPVVVAFQRRIRPHPGRPHFCYVGSLRWRPNVAGLDWFCQKVWPKIGPASRTRRWRSPEWTSGPGRRAGCTFRDAWKAPGVETVGFLDDLEPLYARVGRDDRARSRWWGVRIKVLEALRAGLPVVTTGDGVSGLR